MTYGSSRRRFVGTIGVTLAFLSGCLSGDGATTNEGQTGSPTDRPSETGTDTATETDTRSQEPTETDGNNQAGRTPYPDSVSFETLISGDGVIEKPEASLERKDFRMAYLRSEADVDRLDHGSLTDEQRAFLDDTDFTESAIVAAGLQYPTTETEVSVLGVIRRPKRLETRIWIDEHGALNAEDYDLILVRVTPGNEIPDDAIVVLENDPYEDGEPTEFGTTGND